MKKSDYIEKYGQEAYEELLKRQREYHNSHKEERREYENSHKEEIREYKKKYRDSHKEEIREYEKKYRDTNREVRMAYSNAYRKENYYTKPRLRAYYLMSKYRHSDKEKNLGETTLTSGWIVDNIFSGQSCIYCGETDWRKLGCDRIDNSLPHTPENCVCACSNCNRTRKDKPFEEFVKEKTAV